MDKEYRDTLIEAVDYLIEVRENVFTNALNLAMVSEFKEINDVFEEGDEFNFNLKHLDKSSDFNVQKIVDLIENIETTVFSLININVIKNDELENEV